MPSEEEALYPSKLAQLGETFINVFAEVARQRDVNAIVRPLPNGALELVTAAVTEPIIMGHGALAEQMQKYQPKDLQLFDNELSAIDAEAMCASLTEFIEAWKADPDAPAIVLIPARLAKTLRSNGAALPEISDAFGSDQKALIVSAGPVLAALEAYAHAQTTDRWSDRDDHGNPDFPTFTTIKGKDRNIYALQIRPRPVEQNIEHTSAETEIALLDDTTLHSLWQQVRELNDLDGDVFLALLAQALVGETDAEGCVWLSAAKILDYRGVTPVTKRQENGRRRRAGHRREDLQKIARCIERMNQQWIIIRQQMRTAKPGNKRGVTKRMLTTEAPLVLIAERQRQHEFVLVNDAVRIDTLPVAWRYKMGKWIEPFLEAPNRQVAWLCQRVLQYDPYHERSEKRLARYCLFHLRINHNAAISREVGRLIDELALPFDDDHPLQSRKRFEQALDRLVADEQILSWRYDPPNSKLPRGKWVSTWRSWKIVIEAPTSAAIPIERATQRISPAD